MECVNIGNVPYLLENMYENLTLHHFTMRR